MIEILMIVGGLLLLFIGGEGLVNGSVSLALRIGLSPVLVSAVIIGFGTSMPELTVSLSAALQGSSDIALGNVVGSNIANILLTVGIAALIFPLLMPIQTVKRETWVMLFSTVILLGLCALNAIGFWYGLGLVILLLGYLFWSYTADKKAQSMIDTVSPQDDTMPVIKSVIYALGGLLALIIGAKILVDGSIVIARQFGISETVIGLTIVAIGTSLPELATAVIASIRKHGDVIIGNILGSNIFNILSIIGITSLVLPISVDPQIARFDVWIALGAAIMLSLYLLRGWTIGRITGGIMLGAYILYIGYLYLSGVTL